MQATELSWSSPARVYFSDRHGGVSGGVHASNNLGHHVGDAPESVASNRAQLLDLPGITGVQWLNQIHGTEVLQVHTPSTDMPSVDAMWTDRPGTGLAILTADCLPVIVADIEGQVIGAAHAGWRGLCGGVLPQLLAAMPVASERLQAFIGPAIGTAAFEVGIEVVGALEACGLADCARASAREAGKFQVDLVAACRQQLRDFGVSHIAGGDWCTYSDERFYSYRRETHRMLELAREGEPAVTGRQATVVWLPRV